MFVFLGVFTFLGKCFDGKTMEKFSHSDKKMRGTRERERESWVWMFHWMLYLVVNFDGGEWRWESIVQLTRCVLLF